MVFLLVMSELMSQRSRGNVRLAKVSNQLGSDARLCGSFYPKTLGLLTEGPQFFEFVVRDQAPIDSTSSICFARSFSRSDGLSLRGYAGVEFPPTGWTLLLHTDYVTSCDNRIISIASPWAALQPLSFVIAAVAPERIPVADRIEPAQPCGRGSSYPATKAYV